MYQRNAFCKLNSNLSMVSKGHEKSAETCLSASECVLSAFYQCTIGKDRVEFFMAPVTELLATETCLTPVNFNVGKHVSSTFMAECQAYVLCSIWQESKTDCTSVRLFGICVLATDFIRGREKRK